MKQEVFILIILLTLLSNNLSVILSIKRSSSKVKTRLTSYSMCLSDKKLGTTTERTSLQQYTKNGN